MTGTGPKKSTEPYVVFPNHQGPTQPMILPAQDGSYFFAEVPKEWAEGIQKHVYGQSQPMFKPGKNGNLKRADQPDGQDPLSKEHFERWQNYKHEADKRLETDNSFRNEAPDYTQPPQNDPESREQKNLFGDGVHMPHRVEDPAGQGFKKMLHKARGGFDNANNSEWPLNTLGPDSYARDGGTPPHLEGSDQTQGFAMQRKPISMDI